MGRFRVGPGRYLPPSPGSPCMTIANDAWIRKMAKEHGMITPFEEAQVSKGKISYGVSSYGYDVRVGSHYKIFHNLNSTLVDPKSFDAKSFVDHDGPECIIPPNSFVLAETVERFHIPRNVLAACVGKSTYARCFTGDARVALVDGTSPTLEEMTERANRGESFIGFAIDGQGRVIAAALEHPRWIATDSILELRLDSGAALRCTPDHVFLRRDRSSQAAQDLRPGDALMPLYRVGSGTSERVYQPTTESTSSVRRLVDGHRRRAMRSIEIASARDLEPSYVGATNHKVVSIRELPGRHDVFCLTVPEAGNFALAAGVFVRNCGIIVNVTPLEPEWEGIVTIEISNTTPLPAKIYSNEGIAQILFFKAAPDGICETSYADRKGKYQAQKGLTLPKVL